MFPELTKELPSALRRVPPRKAALVAALRTSLKTSLAVFRVLSPSGISGHQEHGRLPLMGVTPAEWSTNAGSQFAGQLSNADRPLASAGRWN